MVKLNDYLYNGDTVLKILQKYTEDLNESAVRENNEIDMLHCDLLKQMLDILEHNDFLTSQSQKIRDFYKYMAKEYPFLAFTFKGRIKSLIRSEEKFNGYIVEYIHKYYSKYGHFPTLEELKSKLNCFRDLIAYRIIISMPKCHIKPGMDRKEVELSYLYEIANVLPDFLKERGFELQIAGIDVNKSSVLLDETVKPYYRDYISNPSPNGYQSLHITLYDNAANCYIEVQLRTKDMDDYAEIGPANHNEYEKTQETERASHADVPLGEFSYYDDAFQRVTSLQRLELAELDVNMFAAMNNSLINDGCGLFRGRLILPYEHLSRFQNDIID